MLGSGCAERSSDYSRDTPVTSEAKVTNIHAAFLITRISQQVNKKASRTAKYPSTKIFHEHQITGDLIELGIYNPATVCSR